MKGPKVRLTLIGAFTVKTVQYLQGFPCAAACECFRRSDLLATQVLNGRQASLASCMAVRSGFLDQFLPSADIGLS